MSDTRSYYQLYDGQGQGQRFRFCVLASRPGGVVWIVNLEASWRMILGLTHRPEGEYFLETRQPSSLTAAHADNIPHGKRLARISTIHESPREDGGLNLTCESIGYQPKWVGGGVLLCTVGQCNTNTQDDGKGKTIRFKYWYRQETVLG